MKFHSDPGFKIVYLSHPLTTGGATIEHNRASAAKIANIFQMALGPKYFVLNPCALQVPDWKCTTYMSMYAGLFGSGKIDEVYFAPGWEDSSGCKQEWFGAEALGIPRWIIYSTGDSYGLKQV